MLRQSAFEPGVGHLKGALHAHTTRSDGADTPEALLDCFARQGYDFVALTDHRVYNKQRFGSPLTVIPGMELDACIGDSRGKGVHVFHTVCLGPADGGDFAQDERFDTLDVPDAAAFQPLLDEMHRRGCLTMYCHPQWSRTPVHEFSPLRANFGMELWNTGCVYENDLDRDNGLAWDRLLMEGQRLWGTAVDDCHRQAHAGKGYVMVRAENNPAAILQALSEGSFYASCGPEIRDFYVENGQAVVRCSPAAWVGFSWGQAPVRIVFSEAEPLTEARFSLPPCYTYIRAIVRDADGKKAWTNPIFL